MKPMRLPEEVLSTAIRYAFDGLELAEIWNLRLVCCQYSSTPTSGLLVKRREKHSSTRKYYFT